MQLFIAVATDGDTHSELEKCVSGWFQEGLTLEEHSQVRDTMNFLIGGLIGSVVLLAMIGQAIIYLSVFLLTVITGIYKMNK